jgi:hypothetical protein
VRGGREREWKRLCFGLVLERVRDGDDDSVSRPASGMRDRCHSDSSLLAGPRFLGFPDRRLQ